jgi:hypothetical protein
MSIFKKVKKVVKNTKKDVKKTTNVIKEVSKKSDEEINKIVQETIYQGFKKLFDVSNKDLNNFSNEINTITKQLDEINKIIEIYNEFEKKLNFLDPENIKKILNNIIDIIKKKLNIILNAFIGLIMTNIKFIFYIIKESKLIYLLYFIIGYMISSVLLSFRPLLILILPISTGYINILLIISLFLLTYNANYLLSKFLIFLYDIISKIKYEKILTKLINESYEEILKLFNIIFDSLNL